MKNRNENQSKYLANSVRIISMTTFATIGYPLYVSGNIQGALAFAGLVIVGEYLSYQLLKKE